MPPTAVTVADPLLPPLHDTLVEEIEAERAVGSPMITHFEIVHPLASVTVTW